MKKKIVIALNSFIFLFTLLGLGIMLYKNGEEGGLLSTAGWANLKYFTVLSNIFCGVVAGIYLAIWILGKRSETFQRINLSKQGSLKDVSMVASEAYASLPAEMKNESMTAEMLGELQDGPTAVIIRKKNPSDCPAWLLALKLAAAASVTVTFLVVACFFGPLYGYAALYLGSNLWFHLIIPLLAIIEFLFLEGEITFPMTLPAGAPALLYGCFYLGNILINGKGDWPDTNDWYGFMNWGFGVSLIIFAVIVLTNWGTACLLRFINRLINRQKK